MKRLDRMFLLGSLLVLVSVASFLYLSTQTGASGNLPEMSSQLVSQSRQVAEQVDGFARVLHFIQRIIAQ